MKILVTGSGSGLGLCLRNQLAADGHTVHSYTREGGHDVLHPNLVGIEELDVLINNAGINCINWLEHVTDDDWDTVLGVNTKGIFKMTQACLPLLIKSKGAVVNIVSNAAHVPMTGSLAYNASKGAAHIMTLQLARELTKRFGITVFGVAPNKLCDTGMSADIDEQAATMRGWTAAQARAYQLQALLTGQETPPQRVAEFIVWLLGNKERHRFLSGCVIPYGA